MRANRRNTLNSVSALIAFGLGLCLLPQSALAQDSCEIPLMSKCYNTIFTQTGQYGPTYPPKGAILVCQNGTDESFAEYVIRTPACPPPNECPTCNIGGHPIDFATGDTFITQTDVRLPGLGGGINLTRTWNSVLFEGVEVLGMFGTGWTSSYEENVFVGGDGFIKYLRGDGGIWSFVYTGQPTIQSVPAAGFGVIAPANKTATLNQTANNWILVFQNGEQHVFDLNTGKLLSIIDRNGNTTTLTYDASYRLTTVTDPAGRHLYFTYGNFTYANQTGIGGAFLVTNVSSDFGVSLSYTYDIQGHLTQVTKPDSTTISFQYVNNAITYGLISAVLDNNGKVLESHTYDLTGRGLTSSRANGVESITVSYPEPQGYLPP